MIANLAVISNFLAGRGSYEAAAAAPVEELAEDLPTLLQVNLTSWVLTPDLTHTLLANSHPACLNMALTMPVLLHNTGSRVYMSHVLRYGDLNRRVDCTTTLLQELMPFMPEVAREVVPQLVERLVSRITARALRDVFVA